MVEKASSAATTQFKIVVLGEGMHPHFLKIINMYVCL